MKKSLKKLIFVAAALFTGFAASAKTYTNNVGVGFRIPMYTEIKNSDGNGVEYYPTGFDLQYLGYFANGLSLKDNLSVAFGSVSEGSATFTGVNFAERAEVGYGFIRNDKIYLGLFGFLGVDVTAFTNNDNSENKITFTRFVLGADPTFIFTPKNIFSFYASLAMGVGFGSGKTEYGSLSATYDLKTSFVMYPSVGVSWKF